MSKLRRIFSKRRRRGIIAIIAALLMMPVIAMVAMAIDIGYIMMTRTELQSAVDVSTLAGGTELLAGLGIDKTKTPSEVETAARATAVAYAAQNHAGDVASLYAEGSRDVHLGRGYFDSNSGTWQMEWGVTPYNMVGMRLHRDLAGSANADKPLPLIFGPLIGTAQTNLVADAVAVQMPADGFYVPVGSDQGANIMPFAFRDEVWYRRKDAQKWYNDNYATVGPPVYNGPNHPQNTIDPDIEYLAIRDPDDPNDDVQYNSDNPLLFAQDVDNQGNLKFDANGDPVWVQDLFDNYGPGGIDANGDPDYTPPAVGADGILEVDLYPEDPGNQANTAGNSGTIDLGPTNNSAQDIADQILNGISDEDFQAMDEQGMLNENGELVLNDENYLDAEGDTGISGGPITQAMNQILGEPRAIALFSEVAGPGNNAVYTLVEFVGVRVMDVKLTGNPKHIWIQPAKLVDGTAVPNLERPPGDDDDIFTPLILIE